jgi:hypothetical protein
MVSAVRRKISQTVRGTPTWKLDINNSEQSLLSFISDWKLCGWIYTILYVFVNVYDNEEGGGDVANRLWKKRDLNLEGTQWIRETWLNKVHKT